MRFLVVSFFILISHTYLNAQIFGGRIGLGINRLDATDIYIQNSNGVDTFQLSMNRPANSNFAGVFFRMPVGAFYLEVEPMLSTVSYPIRFENLSEWNGGALVKKEEFTALDIGISAGFKLWKAVRFQGGIRSQAWLSYESELNSFTNEYTNEWERFVQSYHVGVGLDIVNMTLDFGYERTLDGIGDNINFMGNAVGFNTNRSRFTVKLGVRIISYEED